MVSLDYDDGDKLLETSFSCAEEDHLKSSPPIVPDALARASDVIFSSKTQAYRETLLGCLIAKIQNDKINIRQPYVDQGELAFSGRTLDERVINPFLQSKQIPCSKGPYLSVFRRSIQFNESTASGLRDKSSYQAFLEFITDIENDSKKDRLLRILRYVLYRFVILREGAKIELARLQRISLSQYDRLVSQLLATQSGGRIPVMLVVAMFETIKESFGLHWNIDSVGINVSDAAAGSVGDITIKDRRGRIVLSIEVTERPVEPSRVQSIFRTKIAPAGLVDYLFLVDVGKISASAIAQAEKYFAQGHEINFIDVKVWILSTLATVGSIGRITFNDHLVRLMALPSVPSILKAAWNREILRLAGQ